MTIVVQAGPEEEPVSVAEAKTHCKISSNVWDSEIESMIIVARQQAELQLHRYLITQTLDAYFDAFPLEFTLPPLQSVTAITYVDIDGDTQTLASNQYIVDAVSQPARIVPAHSIVWPATRDQINAVKVRFVGGYGDAEDVPKCIKHWILQRVGTMFDNRGELVIGAPVAELPHSFVDGLLDSEKVWSRI